jgi:muramidase (phage lysozyme)
MTPAEWSRIQQGIFAGESGGDYGALFGYQNRPNGRFSGVDLTKMTVDQALDFANPSGPYGQYVKGQVGRVATPMGAYQIVGTTLRAAKEGLGLRGDEVLTPAMQDKLGQWIYKTQGTGAWEGYKPMTEGQAIAAETMSLLGKGPQTSTKGPQMMQEQKPQGLLGSLGIQKMEEGAEGETGQRFYNRESFKDTAAVLAQGFGRMGIMGMEEIADQVAKQRTEAKAKNKTMEALSKMNTPQAQAAVEYINAGGDAVSALKMAFERPKPQAGVAVGDRLINPVTGEVIYEDASAPKFDPKDVVTARKEFSSLPPVKQFSDQTSAYGRVVASVDDPSPSGDLALIFNFMKVLDPGSVVREGEFATAQNAGGIDQRTRGLYNRITSGERLTPEQRADFADRATRLYSEAQGQYQSLAEQYAGFAKQAGLPVDQVIPDFSYSKDLYRKPLEFSRPPPPTMPDGTRVSPEEWATAWSNMTEAQRQEFIDGGAN